MSAGTRKDPLPTFCFKVDLNLGGGAGAAAFFKSVTGLKYETETSDVKEGGVNGTTWKLVGATKWSNIVLKRGFTSDSELLSWRDGWMSGQKMERARGTITQLNSKLESVAEWSFEGGWPAKWELSELDASKNEVAIETLEIAHHGLTYKKLK
jgi:phage tail-like protein